MNAEQYFMLEWSNESGSRELVARIYTNMGRRTTAFVPVPEGEWDGNVPKSVWAEAQGWYREDDAKAF